MSALFKQSLVWFRRDLRCFDHAALHAALTQSERVFCVFIFDKTILQSLPKQDRRVRFIHQSITELAEALGNLSNLSKPGGHLIVRYGYAEDEIVRLAKELQVQAVFINRDYEPSAIARDAEVERQLSKLDCTLHNTKDHVIFEQHEVLTLAETPFSVFTPYKNAWLKKLRSEDDDFYSQPYPIEKHAHRLANHLDAHHSTPAPSFIPTFIPTLSEMGFEMDLKKGSEPSLSTGMSGGALLLEDFLPRIGQYDKARDFPALNGVSNLSTHLRFGTVSIRHLVRIALEKIRASEESTGAQTWLSELIWRDFYFMILYHHPHVVDHAFKRNYEEIQWESGAQAQTSFEAWCEGRTGYPLVDAAMHQLNQTGSMHNRLRMVTACFLVKDLGIDWRWGERYFARHLNDFDLAANTGGWQWAASTGCDAQPYFRIFNPVTQSEKFDSEGHFIRRYLPQLAKLDNRQIHAPWKLSAEALRKCNVCLGENYPHPIVDHDVARKRTLERFGIVKKLA